MELFGFSLNKIEDKKISKKDKLAASFVAPTDVDGATASSQVNNTYWNFDAIYEGISEQINVYRTVAMNTEVSSAVDEIVNDSIVIEDNVSTVELMFSTNSEVSDKIQKLITEEFKEVLNIFNFNYIGDELFRTWYVDGQIYFHIVLDKAKKNIADLRYIDPRYIKKVRDVIKEKNKQGIEIVVRVDEYYIYQDPSKKGTTTSKDALKIPSDAIIHVTSNMSNGASDEVVSYLHPAVKPFNQLNHMEDALVVYRAARATERRVFYVDVGNLPKTKAEQYMRSISNKHNNKVTYNTSTGIVKNNKNTLSMMEDLWIPRRDGSRSTEVDTLPGGAALGDIIDVEYFKKKLMKSLKVPVSRLESDAAFSMGVANEITRDEMKFAKYVSKLQRKFSRVFTKALKTQLVLKKIITVDEWDDIRSAIQYKFNTNSHFSEMKEAELLEKRLETLSTIDEYVGKYYSLEFVRKNVLQQSEESIDTINKQIEAEKKAGLIAGDDEDY